jgi:hypothetical protein
LTASRHVLLPKDTLNSFVLTTLKPPVQ